MMLFDLLQKLNTEITEMMNAGLPGEKHPLITASTDGSAVLFYFLDKEIWNSTQWSFGTGSEQQELDKLERHLKLQVQEYIDLLYLIQW